MSEIDVHKIRYQLIKAYADREMIDFDKIKQVIQLAEYPISDSHTFELLSQIYYKTFQYDLAIHYSQEAIKLDSDNFACHFIILKSASYLKNKELVQDKFHWLISATPPYSNEKLELLIVAHELALYHPDMLEDGLDMIDLVDDYSIKKILIDYIVSYYLEHQQADLALDFLNNIQDPFLNKVELSPAFARTFAKLNHSEEACYYFDLALEQSVSNSDLVLEYVSFLKEENFPDLALEISEKYQDIIYDKQVLNDLQDTIQDDPENKYKA